MRFLVLLGFLATAFAVQAHEKDTLVGHWKVSKKGDQFAYHFVNDSTLRVAHAKDTSVFKVKMDTAAAWPRKIDIIQIDQQTGDKLYTYRGLYEFVGPTKVRIRFGEGDKERPASFMPKGKKNVKGPKRSLFFCVKKMKQKSNLHILCL